MKLVFASDSFKGSLSSEQTASLLTKAAYKVFGNIECVSIPMADGGEGSTDAVIRAVNGEKICLKVHGPLFDPIDAFYGKVSHDKAILEMAEASGLAKIPEGQRNPLETSTYGTGEMIIDALERGFTDITIAIGGSATNDGGMGCMRALGARFYDKEGNELSGCGKDLERVSRINTDKLDSRLTKTHITVICDVKNVLCGPDGATYTFGKQKGATPEMLQILEAGMCNYRDRIIDQFGINPDEIPGSGAAGGLGAALSIFLHAALKSGIEAVLDITGFDEHINNADLVVTGEGRTDWQSCFGKVMQGVGNRCKKRGVPVVGLSGSLGVGAENIYEYGVCSLMSITDRPMSLEYAMEKAEQLYYDAAVRMFQLIAIGQTTKSKSES